MKRSIFTTALLAIACTAVCSNASADLVQGYEFAAADGWVGNAGGVSGGVTVSGGLISGTATNTDPQLINNPVSITKTLGDAWTTLEYRVRETDSTDSSFVPLGSHNPTGLVTQLNGLIVNGNTTPGLYTFTDGGDNFINVSVDISSFGLETITNLRVDPIGGASGPVTTGNLFEVDYIRINDSSAVPEPTSLALFGIAGIGIMIRRRRIA